MKGQTNSRAFVNTLEKVYITISTDLINQSDLIGTIVNISYEDVSYDYIWNGMAIKTEIKSGIEYTITFHEVNEYFTPEPLTFIAQPLRINNVEVVYNTWNYIMTTVQIDENNHTFTRIVDKGGVEAIRENTRAYNAYLYPFNNTVPDGYILELGNLSSSTNVTYFLETIERLTETSSAFSMGLYIRLPKFYYKVEEVESDVWNVIFVYGEKPNNSFKEHDGMSFIGAYLTSGDGEETSVSLDNHPSSQPGTLLDALTPAEIPTLVESCDPNAKIMDWKHHCLFTILGMVYYNTKKLLEICGNGDGNIKNSGSSTGALFVDSNTSSSSVYFWGLEHWWGNGEEFISGISIDNSTDCWRGNDSNGSRLISSAIITNGSKYISKLFIGEFLDLIPSEAGNGNYYKSKVAIVGANTSSVYRSGLGGDSDYGPLSLTEDSNTLPAAFRLMYINPSIIMNII